MKPLSLGGGCTGVNRPSAAGESGWPPAVSAAMHAGMVDPGNSRPPWPTSDSAVDGVLARLMRPAEAGRRRKTLAAVSASVFFVGWVDFATGSRLSLAVVYLLPVVLATAWLGRRAGVITAAASMAVRFLADLLGADSGIAQTWLWWNSLAGLVVCLVVVWILDALIRLHRQLEQRVRQRTLELEQETRRRQEVQRELLDLSANERSAMGRELHDQLGQHLVGTAMAAQVLAQRLQGQEDLSGQARRIAALLEQGVAETRQLAHGLLLTQVEPERLVAELEELCSTLRQQYPRVACGMGVRTAAQLRDAAAAAQAFRIGQEALRNAFRHSGASRVGLTLDTDSAGRLVLTVVDDGRGLPQPGERKAGMGLRIMRHRAEHLGADLQIETMPGGGTRIRCTFPPELTVLPSS